MKTFNEAFEELHNESIAVTIANLETSTDYLTNEKWVSVIYSIAADSIRAIANSDTNNDLLAIVCASLQNVFQLGVLTGIKMEKPDA